MTQCDHTQKYQQLLRDLKTTIESLLVTQVANVWDIYGGLNRLHSCLDKIFRHGCKNQGTDGISYFHFIQGLEWLQPESSKSCFSLDSGYKSHLPQNLKDDPGSIWLYRSMENHTLSQKLAWLLSDKTHLLNCYQEFAFLVHDKYSEATLICLRAIERNQASLMSEIDPCLFILQASAREFHKLHRRCSSYPDEHSRIVIKPEKPLKTCLEEKPSKIFKGKLKPWNSMPNLQKNHIRIEAKIVISRTTPSTPVHGKKIDSKSLQVRRKKCVSAKRNSSLKETKHVIINNRDIVEHTPPLSSSQSSSNFLSDDSTLKTIPEKSIPHSPRLVDSFLPLSGEKDYQRVPKKSFIEDGGMSVLPMATGYFPRPHKGQTLLSFLSSGQFARANAELDRENAHFSISEAIISAMEQIKCKKDLKLSDEQFDESDPEIIDLKQRIRLRRRQKLAEKQRKVWTESLLSDGKTDTATSASPRSTSPDTLTSSSEDTDDLDLEASSNLSDRGLSISMASLYSEADVLRRPRGAPDGASDVFSAEGVALSLISKFREKQLPRASDLEWLVSEEEVPQALLPLPKSFPISPDDSESSPTPLRGTREWAPPRPQIIFTVHTPPLRKELMTRQNYRCAGCSMKVAPQYASRFRYCNYLGRYFCTGCHRNQLALIPGRVLQKWDFNRYKVSSFSYRLLEQMYFDPLFRPFELNKNIGKMSKNLQFCKNYRTGLFYLKDFIFTCRFAETIMEILQQEKSYLLTDPEVYSMEDLVNVSSGEMKKKLQYLVDICCRHTAECELCSARGFVCEMCNDNKVIFPWQLRKVKRCSRCGACYHTDCWNSQPCLKCARINRRKSQESTSTLT